MPKRTDISSILVIGAGKPLPDGEGLGWGSEAQPRVSIADVEPPSPALPRRGREKGELAGRVVFEPIVAVGVEGEFFGNPQHDAVGVFQHIVVPESNHTVAARFDHPRSCLVAGTITVLTTIDLDHQLGATAGEIGHGISNLEFARELHAKLFRPQSRPKSFRRVGRLAPQLLRNRRQSFARHTLDIPTEPSPERGRAAPAIAS